MCLPLANVVMLRIIVNSVSLKCEWYLSCSCQLSVRCAVALDSSFDFWIHRMTFFRFSGRMADQLCLVCIECAFIRHVEGSVLVSFGDIYVLCTVSVENCVLNFLRGKGEGWVIVEYGMLPRFIHICFDCEVVRGK